MNDRHLKIKDAIEVVRETVADEYIESTLELRLLDKSLTANVVEVVRCKDCKYWQDQEEGIVEVPICTREDCFIVIMGENDFCSKGERAEE